LLQSGKTSKKQTFREEYLEFLKSLKYRMTKDTF